MSNVNQEKAVLLSELKKVKAALDDFSQAEIQASSYTYENYYNVDDLIMPICPKKLIEPKKPLPPVEPSPIKEPDYDSFCKEYKEKNEVDISLESKNNEWYKFGLECCFALGGTLLFFSLMMPILRIIAFVLLGGGIAILFLYKNKNKKLIIDSYNELCEQIRKNNIEAENQYLNETTLFNENNKLYEIQMVEYNKNKPDYNKRFSEYTKKKSEYDAVCAEREAAAKEKANQLADEVRKSAQEAYEAALNNIEISYPEKYNFYIEDIIDIIQNCRADSLKEAIAVLEDDQYKASMLRKQERLIEEQKEFNREQELANEEADRKAQEAVYNARRQCKSCANWVGCPMSDRITSVCPNYIKKY